MVFANVDELLHMNGHGPYVWASYGVAVIVLAGLVIAPLRRLRRLKADIARQARRDAPQNGPVPGSTGSHTPEK